MAITTFAFKLFWWLKTPCQIKPFLKLIFYLSWGIWKYSKPFWLRYMCTWSHDQWIWFSGPSWNGQKHSWLKLRHPKLFSRCCQNWGSDMFPWRLKFYCFCLNVTRFDENRLLPPTGVHKKVFSYSNWIKVSKNVCYLVKLT